MNSLNDSSNKISHAQIYFLDELDMIRDGESVRILGYVKEIDYRARRCIVIYEKYSVVVDLQLVPIDLIRIDGLYQFFGLVMCNEVSINMKHQPMN